MKNKNDIASIMKRFLSGHFSSETEERVHRWIIKDEDKEEKEKASLAYWSGLEIETNADTYSALERVNKRIGYPKRIRMIPLYQKITQIAAVLIPVLLITGGYLYYTSTKNNFIEVHTAYGEEKHLFLPDSSEIWINAGTNIKYLKKFKGDQRTVYLDGEAYFSVKRDETRPFTVQTAQLSVKVLGTKFNIKAYTSENKSTTTLTSGKVEVSTNRNDTRILKPNEQLTFNYKNSAIDVIEIPANETDGWITGQLIFTNASFDEIIQTLKRRFDITITSGNHLTSTSNKLYTVKFLKNEDLDTVLIILKDVIGFSYQRNGHQIILDNGQ